MPGMTLQRRRLLTLLGPAILGLAAPVTAGAADRFAAPDGTGNSCTQGAPCSLPTALFGATDGDVVTAAPGTYAPGAFVLSGVTLRGTPGQPRPRIVGDDITHGSQAEAAVRVFDRGIVRGIDIDVTQAFQSSVASVTGLRLEGAGALAEQVRVTATGTAAGFARGADVSDGATLRDSRVRASGPARDRVLGLLTGRATIVGATVVSDGTGMFTSACADRADAVTATVHNSIVRGGSEGTDRDVVAQAPQTCSTIEGSPTETSAVTVSSSNFRPDRSSGAITSGSGNQTVAPALDASLAQVPGSPTIDAGAADPRQGDADADGDPRVAGAAVDIGGDEFAAAPAPPSGAAPAPQTGAPAGGAPSGPAPGPTDPAPAQVPAPDRLAPSLGKVSLTPTTVRRRRGTVLKLTLSEPATVVVRIEQVRRGRRAGKACSLRARRGKRCTVTRLQRTITTRRSSGPARITVPTRSAAKVLAVGSYRLVITATDAAGNRSAKRTVSFTVRR